MREQLVAHARLRRFRIATGTRRAAAVCAAVGASLFERAHAADRFAEQARVVGAVVAGVHCFEASRNVLPVVPLAKGGTATCDRASRGRSVPSPSLSAGNDGASIRSNATQRRELVAAHDARACAIAPAATAAFARRRKACEFWSAMMTASTLRACACSRERLADVGEVTVVAPDRDRSGASNSLTLDQPIRVVRARRRPLSRRRHADRLRASRAVGPARPRARHRRVRHQQLGQSRRRRDLFRHRVGGDGRALPRLPAIAISLASIDHKGIHYDSAAEAVLLLMRKLLIDPLPADTILNVNVPDRPWREISGFAVTRLGRRHRSAAMRRADRSARPADLLDRSARRSRGRRPRHRFPCGPRRARFRSRRSMST